MRVPILLKLPSQEVFVRSAQSARDPEQRPTDIRDAVVPDRVELDARFPAIPIGTGVASSMTPESIDPERSQQFVINGFIEVESLADVPEEIDGQQAYANVPIQTFPTCPGSPPVGTAADVKAKLEVAKLAAAGLTGERVAVAIVDTGINIAHLRQKLGNGVKLDAANSWKYLGLNTLPGNHPVDHGTMCAFDALLAAPQATLIDYPVLTMQVPAGAPSAGTIGTALAAYSHILTNWAVLFAGGGLGHKYRALVISNSWGVYHPDSDFPSTHRGRYVDNPKHPFAVVVAALAAAGADIVFAAGNCGADCPSTWCNGRTAETIMGANAHPDVLTLAGCDHNDLRVGYSSQGPSIAKMHREKPDVTAYTHFLGAEYKPGSPDSGTSTACPVAAGCVAALRTKESPFDTPPSALFDQLRATARSVVRNSGWNSDYGHGIINPLAAAQSMGLVPSS